MSSPKETWRQRLHTVIFESDTRGGKAFDVVLTVMILTSVALVIVESVPEIRAMHGKHLYFAELLFTAAFTLEYVLRLVAVRRPLAYALSFFGVVDLLAILPTFLSFLLPGAHSLLVIRIFRVLRVFRIFKLRSYLAEAKTLRQALILSRPKIIVFLVAVSSTVVSVGAFMYLIEGEKNGFTSIPTGIYWAIVTVTTVGFGDITPKTPFGQALASLLMILGYGVIAVPTGIVTSELIRSARPVQSAQACPNCSSEGHDFDARYCKYCGVRL